ncbi:BT_3987 domain-containing protein [Saccharicrinis sp. 156]|uniref:BT_3987 domain-containing protein n=1 Tax=Saccharicrinis sp. 156 TaxID=3417574 RepID=UPI003D35559B
MRKIIFALIVIAFTGCKYDDEYLDPSLDTIAYFASFENHSRTVVVGEGLNFKVGVAMAGELTNTEDRTVDFMIYQSGLAFEEEDDLRELMPTSFYNADELSGTFQTIIPKGEFLGFFDVVMDSVAFLSDPLSLDGTYTLPVKILATSLDSIGKDSVNISVKYMCGVDGYYLFDESVIRREIEGTVLEDKTTTEEYKNESDDSAWRLATLAPFQVEATGATTSFNGGLKFNITVQDGNVSLQSIEGEPVVEADGENTYDSSTRDFMLNFKYQKPEVGNDTIYHVSTKLVFRNRVRDGVNETRDYLSYFNN